MGDKIKVIMDCDPGIDDGIALAYAAAHQDELELLAVTTSAGSTRIERVTQNALELVDFYRLKVPVAGGQDRPLVKAAIYAEEFHGETGLGHCVLPEAKSEAASDNAVLFIRDILKAIPEGEQVVMIETAPMTNLALLLKVFPEIKNKIRKIVFTGGAAKGGNITPAAEFNIYADPEAAKIVFDSGIPLIMCGLDATLKCNLTRNQIMKLCQSGDPAARACGDMAGYLKIFPNIAAWQVSMLLYRLCISSIRSSLKQKKYSWMWIVQTVLDGVPHYAISAGGYTKKTK